MEVRPIRYNKTQFFPSSGSVLTNVWMHHLDTDYVYTEKGLMSITQGCSKFLNKSWKQYPIKKHLNRHQPLILKTIQIRRTRHTRHFWSSEDVFMCDFLLWTPSHERASAGRPVRNYRQQLCTDTGCRLEHLSETMDDSDGCLGRVRETLATIVDML